MNKARTPPGPAGMSRATLETETCTAPVSAPKEKAKAGSRRKKSHTSAETVDARAIPSATGGWPAGIELPVDDRRARGAQRELSPEERLERDGLEAEEDERMDADLH